MKEHPARRQPIADGILGAQDRSEFEDLIADRPGDEVLAAYVAGSLDRDSTAALDRYFAAHPEERSELEELRAVMHSEVRPEPVRRGPKRAAVLLVLALAVASGGAFAGRVFQGRRIDLTWEEARAVSEDPTDPNRALGFARCNHLVNAYFTTQASVANGDPEHAPTPDLARSLGNHARIALFWRAREAIEALAKVREGTRRDSAEQASKLLENLQRTVERSLK